MKEEAFWGYWAVFWLSLQTGMQFSSTLMSSLPVWQQGARPSDHPHCFSHTSGDAAQLHVPHNFLFAMVNMKHKYYCVKVLGSHIMKKTLRCQCKIVKISRLQLGRVSGWPSPLYLPCCITQTIWYRAFEVRTVWKRCFTSDKENVTKVSGVEKFQDDLVPRICGVPLTNWCDHQCRVAVEMYKTYS